jgi:hypothetical protein
VICDPTCVPSSGSSRFPIHWSFRLQGQADRRVHLEPKAEERGEQVVVAEVAAEVERLEPAAWERG